MDKGIRPAILEKFVEQNELRRRGLAPYAGSKANTIFRKNVMAHVMEAFGCTLAAAATHYNYALITVREATPELVAQLGRPEDKKGGRKRKEVPTATNVAVTETAPTPVPTAADVAALVDNMEPVTVADVGESNVLNFFDEISELQETVEEVVEEIAPEDIQSIPDTTEFVDADMVPQDKYTVKCKATGELLQEDMSLEDARELVQSGRWHGKFRKMYFV